MDNVVLVGVRAIPWVRPVNRLWFASMSAVAEASQSFEWIRKSESLQASGQVTENRTKSASNARSQQVRRGFTSSRRRIAESRHFKHICVFQLNSWLPFEDYSVNRDALAQADRGTESRGAPLAAALPVQFVRICRKTQRMR